MEKTITFCIENIKINQFATFEENFNGDLSEVEMSSSFAFAFNFEKEIVCCSISSIIDRHNLPIIKAEVQAYYKISEVSIDMLINGNDIVLTPDLQIYFATLTYNTLRGIIVAKTEGDMLSKIILPPYDISKVIKQPLTIAQN